MGRVGKAAACLILSAILLRVGAYAGEIGTDFSPETQEAEMQEVNPGSEAEYVPAETGCAEEITAEDKPETKAEGMQKQAESPAVENAETAVSLMQENAEADGNEEAEIMQEAPSADAGQTGLAQESPAPEEEKKPEEAFAETEEMPEQTEAVPDEPETAEDDKEDSAGTAGIRAGEAIYGNSGEADPENGEEAERKADGENGNEEISAPETHMNRPAEKAGTEAPETERKAEEAEESGVLKELRAEAARPAAADCSAKDYSAKAEGFTSAAIRAAVASLGERGGSVYLPEGVYSLTETVVIPAFVMLFGDGPAKTVLKAASSLSAVLKTEGYDGFAADRTAKWHDTKGVPMQFSVKGMTLDGDGKAQDGIDAYGYSFSLRNLNLKNMKRNGIDVSWGSGSSDAWKDGYSKFFEAYVSDVNASDCGGTGVRWSNLTDAYLDEVNVSRAGTGFDIGANIYAGRISADGCGTGVRTSSDNSFEDVRLESCGTGLKAEGWLLNADRVSCSGNRENDIVFARGSAYSDIREYISGKEPAGGYVKNEGTENRIGVSRLNGAVRKGGNMKTDPDEGLADEIRDVLDSAKKASETMNAGLPCVNVKDFGAKGTRADDDTAAIQAAIDSLRQTGGTVFFPAGTYRIMKKLLVYSGITVKGAGPYSSQLYLGDGANNAEHPTDVTSMMETYGNVKSVKIADIGFFGNRYDGHNAGVAGLTLHGSGIVIDNVWAFGMSGYSVYLGTKGGEGAAASYVNGLRVKYGADKGLIVSGDGTAAIDNTAVSSQDGIGADLFVPVTAGHIHLYSNRGVYQIEDRAGLAAGTLISESAYGTAVRLESPQARIGMLQCYANRGTNLQITAPAAGAYIGTYQCRNPMTAGDAVKGEAYGRIAVRRTAMSLPASEIRIPDAVFSGKALTPTVSYAGLKEGKDYSVSYRGNMNAGTAEAVITGIGDYIGARTCSFRILPKNIADVTVTPPAAVTYAGKAMTPAVMVKGFAEGKDYTVSYRGNVNAGTASAVISGKGNLRGTRTVTFEIHPKSISGFSADLRDRTYSGAAHAPAVTVQGLAQGKDYAVLYRNNVNAGTASVTVTGRGNYAGTVTKTFRIAPKKIPQLLGDSSAKYYTGKAVKPYAHIPGLKEGRDYDLSYSGNVKTGTACVTAKGKGNYAGTSSFRFRIVPDRRFTVKLKKSSFVYTGKDIRPQISSVANLNAGISGKYWTVTYSADRNAGTGTAKVTGKGKYKGYSGTASFTIRPPKTVLSSFSPASGSGTVRWKRNSQADGYRIEYSLSSKFSGAGIKEVSGRKTVSAVLKGLAKGKKYFVRISAYRISGGKKIYGPQSTVKTAKIR